MVASSTWKPYTSLTEAPTNLKEAIDWVLRVTGRDGKPLNKETECICGLAAAVTDLLQSVELEYHGYEGDGNANGGATDADKTPQQHINDLFSLVQGLGGTAVVRTYIDQLAQALSAIVGWSRIMKCQKYDCNTGTCQRGRGTGHGKFKCCCGNNGNHNGGLRCCKGQNGADGGKCRNGKVCDGSSKGDSCRVVCANGCCSHGGTGCKYLDDVKLENSCNDCQCKIVAGKGHHLAKGCTKCSSDDGKKTKSCHCKSSTCSPENCQCAKAGKCCKCCCTSCSGTCKEKCICDKVDPNGYRSAYPKTTGMWVEGGFTITWVQLGDTTFDSNGAMPPSQRRQQCARILLGSVCLIWSGITYMYWTGRYAESSPRWNNHILDGTGLDDGSLSQWLQAVGFPHAMLNNSVPENRLDQVITDEFRDRFYLGFPDTSNSAVHGRDNNANTFRSPANLTYGGFIHKINKGAFDKDGPFKDYTEAKIDNNKLGPILKLHILSCAYFTGLQKRRVLASTQSTTNTPKTIREILYWLSALPYSPAYKGLLNHCKEKLTEVTKDNPNKYLSFHQTGRTASINVQDVDLYSHFQAVTQYCPLVLIGIQGGLHSTKGADSSAIHSLYANSNFSFTYPTLDIQVYNQVVHYIRALFYQLYFLRKQCAVKVTSGGKWRECRYGKDVVSKGVISWMCLGCSPMEHDRNYRVNEMEKGLDGVKTGGDELAGALKELLLKIGEVVIQLGNAQEALEGKDKDVIAKVKGKVTEANKKLGEAKEALDKVKDVLNGQELTKAKTKLGELTKNGGGSGDLLGKVDKALGNAISNDFDQGKNAVTKAINGVRHALDALKEGVEGLKKKEVDDAKKCLGDVLLEVTPADQYDIYKTYFEMIQKLQYSINDILSLCTTPKCPGCKDHSTKCGKTPVSRQCPECHQQYMDGFPSPLQAFLEDRLPGFSCNEVLNTEDTDNYPPAASHLGHCGGSGQCCPLPMGFRNCFYSGSTSDCTGQRLYGILCFFSNENMMESCAYTLVRVTAELSATTPQVLGDVFGFFKGGVGNPENKVGDKGKSCDHSKELSQKTNRDYFCGWCASGLRDEVKNIQWIHNGTEKGGHYMGKVGAALIGIKGDKDTNGATPNTTSLSTLTEHSQFISPLTGELYTAVSATFGHVYLQWVLYLSDALEGGLRSLSEAFLNIQCNGCKGQCDPNKCKKGEHGKDSGLCQCSSIVSCTGVLPVLYRHGFSYGNPFNLEGYQQKNQESGDYSITDNGGKKYCHEFLESLNSVINKKQDASQNQEQHPLTKLLSEVGKLQYDIRLPWIFVLTLAWLVAVLYLAFGAIWPLDWTHMRSHWLRGGEHQWQCMWYKVMTGRKGMELVEYFGRKERE
ncbi:variant erythrocyte surface antigen-1 alpha subunit [Babesia bovis T2Bo]|uniref:variant erythrocyte surface antigen-1 alpha subunit n=1 Tax=Babesia bovis T2Bo TaxID=484906 RepID=UPI001C348EB2|nr:variant erythrocyte surface antigen-1 alpha subunit [Babesia bovis T2Bo]EDO06188.2 variant erythrocyte surface antigen-1 alpha subunit [Babesia bovis T2Bo]